MGDPPRPIATPQLPQTRPTWRTANAPAAAQQQQRAYPTPPPSSRSDSSRTNGTAPPSYSPLLPFFDPTATARPKVSAPAPPRPAAPAAHRPHATVKERARRAPTLDEFLGPRDSSDPPDARDAAPVTHGAPSFDARFARRPSAASSTSPHASSAGTLPSPSPVPAAPAAGPSRLAWAAPSASASAQDRQELRRYTSAPERRPNSPERQREAEAQRVAHEQRSAHARGDLYVHPKQPRRHLQDDWPYSKSGQASTSASGGPRYRQPADHRSGTSSKAVTEERSRHSEALSIEAARREQALRAEKVNMILAQAAEYEKQQKADAARSRTMAAGPQTTNASWEQGYRTHNAPSSSAWASYGRSTMLRPPSSSSSRPDDMDPRRDTHNSTRSLSSSSPYPRRPSTSLSPVVERAAAAHDFAVVPMYRRNGTQPNGGVDYPQSNTAAAAGAGRFVPPTQRRAERPAVAAAAAPPPSNRGKRGPRGPISETSFSAKAHAGASRIPWTLTSARSHNTMYLNKLPTATPSSSSSSAPPAATTALGAAAASTRAPSAALVPRMMLPAEFRTGAISPTTLSTHSPSAVATESLHGDSVTAAYPQPPRSRDRDSVPVSAEQLWREFRAEQNRESRSSEKGRTVSPDRHRRRYPHLWAEADAASRRPMSVSTVSAGTGVSPTQIRPGDVWPAYDHLRPPPARRPAKAADDPSHRRYSQPSPPPRTGRRPTSSTNGPTGHVHRQNSHVPTAVPDSRRRQGPAYDHSRHHQAPQSTAVPSARDAPRAAQTLPHQPVAKVAKRPTAPSEAHLRSPSWIAADLGLCADVDDAPKRPFSILADLATRWSSSINLECRCTSAHGGTVDLLVSDNEAKHAAEWCSERVPVWIPGIPSCRDLREERARGVKLTAAEEFLEAAQYLLALEHIGTDEMGCGFPCPVQLERLSDIAKASLGIVFDQDPDANSLMCVVFAATFCDFVDVRDLPLLMDRPKSSPPTPDAETEDDTGPSTPFLYISVANWYACGIVGNDDKVFNPDLSFLPGQDDLLSELKGVIHLPKHELSPLKGISLRCMVWVLVQELLTLAREVVSKEGMDLWERLSRLDFLYGKWQSAMAVATARQGNDLGGTIAEDSVLAFLQVEMCALELFVSDAMLIFALNRELSTDDIALLMDCDNDDLRDYVRRHWDNKVEAAQRLLRLLVMLSALQRTLPTVATLAYVLEVAKAVVEINGVTYKMGTSPHDDLSANFDAVAAWIERIALHRAEVYPYPLTVTRHFVKTSQQAVNSWAQWTVLRANAKFRALPSVVHDPRERIRTRVPEQRRPKNPTPSSDDHADERVRPADDEARHERIERMGRSRPPRPVDDMEDEDAGAQEVVPPTPDTPGPVARMAAASPDTTAEQTNKSPDSVGAEDAAEPDFDKGEAATPPTSSRKRPADSEPSPSTPPSRRRRVQESPPMSASPRRSSRLEGHHNSPPPASSVKHAKTANIRFWSAATSDLTAAPVFAVRQM